MASDDLRARMFNAVNPALNGFFVPLSRRQAVADALLAIVQPELGALRVELDELLDRLDDDTVGPDAQVSVLLDQLAELLPDADPAADMEHYLRQARAGHHRALRARDRRLAAEARLAEVRRYCEAMADSCHVPSRQTARDIVRYIDTGSWNEPTTKETAS